ncbi:MAG: hypothetical protein H8E30_10630 [Alphaproteobacteria bacterium]|nr:hypothetical protein [Alphaproteobacteria bacterium]
MGSIEYLIVLVGSAAGLSLIFLVPLKVPYWLEERDERRARADLERKHGITEENDDD